MENKLDKLFRDKLAQKVTAYDPNAWGKVAKLIPNDDDKRNRRRGLWIFLGLMTLGGFLGKIIYSDIIEMENAELVEIEKTNSNEELAAIISPSPIDSNKPDDITKNDIVNIDDNTVTGSDHQNNGNIQRSLSIDQSVTDNQPISNNLESEGLKMLLDNQKSKAKSKNENISKSNSNNQNKSVNPNVVVSGNEIDLNKIKNTDTGEKDIVGHENQINNTESKKEEPFLAIELLPQVNFFLNEESHLSITRNRRRIIQPIEEGDIYNYRISVFVEGGKFSRLSSGLQLEKNISGSFGLYTGIEYIRWNNQPSVLATDQVSNYGFGVDRTTRTFEQKVMNEISIPLGIQYGYKKIMLGMDLNLNYLLGIHGYINTVAEGEISTRSSWIKEYGVKKWNMGIGAKIDYRVYRRVRLGGAIQYYLSDRYDNEYYNAGGFALPTNRDFQFSIKITYDLFK